MAKHPDYNRTNYPTMVCRHGHWDIMRNDSGHCAAIPNESGEKSGCRASQFGDMTYVRQVLAREMLEFEDEQALTYALALATQVDEVVEA